MAACMTRQFSSLQPVPTEDSVDIVRTNPIVSKIHDRDANAAQNILQEGLSIYYSSAHLAC